MMSKKFNHPLYGEVLLTTAILETNGTDLVDGIEIKFIEEDFPIIEQHGCIDIDELTDDEVTKMIDDYIDFNDMFN